MPRKAKTKADQPCVSVAKSFYLVGALIQSHDVELQGMRYRTSLSLTWADGMVGVLPIFDSYEAAAAYSNGKFAVMQFQAETMR